MNSVPNLFWAHAVLLLAVIAPIARAEQNPWYLGAAAISVAVGFLTTVLRNRPILASRMGQAIIAIAFALVVVDYVLFEIVLVMSLSHFMMVVCMIKLLQARSLRDDVQVQVLCLLLLVVAGIVSGDVLFTAALAAVLLISLPTFMSIHATAELTAAARTGVVPASSAMLPATTVTGASTEPGRYRGVSMGIAATGLLAGVLVFIVSPRFQVNMLRDLQAPHATAALTGLSSNMDISSGQILQESDRPAMRVKILGPEEDALAYDQGHYFRAAVCYRYTRRAGGLGGGWGWRRPTRNEEASIQTHRFEDGQSSIPLAPVPPLQPTVQYQFWLASREGLFLPVPSPPLEIASHDLDELQFYVREQVLQTVRPAGKITRYTVTSVDTATSSALPPVGDLPAEPDLWTSERKLPRADEMLQRVDERLGAAGDLTAPAAREAFLRRLRDWLGSDEFTYALSVPPGRPGREPVGEFLLDSKTGHCEFFASAMALVCQYKGIPARLVTGYHGGDYNYFGHFLVVREKHAHAWVEAFIPGKGWLIYDPTPGAWRAPSTGQSWIKLMQVYLDYMQFQWGNTVVSFNAGSRRELFDNFHAWLTRPAQDETTILGAVVAFLRELFWGRLELTPADRVLYWVFAVLVLILLVMVAFMVVSLVRWGHRRWVRWRRRHSRPRGSRGDVEFYRRFCRRLEALGLHRPPGQTPAEFARSLSTRHPSLQAAPELIQTYYEVAYGGRELAPERRTWIETFLLQLRDLRPDRPL